MIIFDYVSDLNFIQKQVKPFIKGVDLIDNLFLTNEEILLKVSNIISVDDFKEANNRSAICTTQLIRRFRRLIIEDSSSLIELEYPRPFTGLDWNAINQLPIKLRTQGEILNDYLIKNKI